MLSAVNSQFRIVLIPLKARGLLLCPGRQSKQIALFCQLSESFFVCFVSFCYRLICSFNFSLLAQAAWLLLLFSVTKVSKNTLFCHRSERSHNHLIGDYSISPLCFKEAVLPYLCLKESSYQSSPLDFAFIKLSQSSATLRCSCSLQSHYSTVVGRCYVLFFGFDGVSLLLTKKVSCIHNS